MKREDCYISEVDYIDGDASSYNGVFVRFKDEEVFRINNGYGEFFGDSDLIEEKAKIEYADRPLLAGKTWFNYISDLAELLEIHKYDPVEGLFIKEVKFKMQKPTVYSVNLMYLEEKDLYAIYFTINTIDKLEYITIDTGKNYDRMLKCAEELATLIKTDFVNEFKVLINK